MAALCIAEPELEAHLFVLVVNLLMMNDLDNAVSPSGGDVVSKHPPKSFELDNHSINLDFIRRRKLGRCHLGHFTLMRGS